jgi:lysozyme
MRQINSAGLALLKEFEGLELRAYPDPGTGGSPWTIGFGHTGPVVHPGLEISEAQAEGYLRADLAKFEAGVEKLIGDAPVNENMFSACVSLAYNIGLAAFERSTVLKRIKLGNKMGAANAFLMWNRAGGRVMAGLMRRREAERKLFLS